MPKIEVVFFQDNDGSVPALMALDYYEEHDQNSGTFAPPHKRKASA
jgi:hypothetical protein